MMIRGIVLTIVTLFVSGCGGLEKLASCTKDIAQLRTQNTISAECRSAIGDLLPRPQDNLKDRVVSLGDYTQGEAKYLSFVGTDTHGDVIGPGRKFTIIEHRGDGTSKTLNPDEYHAGTLDTYPDIPRPALSLSSIIDYSASMRDEDIDDAVAIYKDIFRVFRAGFFESEIRIFSAEVERKRDFSDNATELQKAITRDDTFERNSTALLDAMGNGLEALHERSSPFKLLVVTTDGIENDSKTYTTSQTIYQLTREYRIPVVMIGALFSDVTFMKKMAEESGGIFIYAKSIRLARERAEKLVEMIKNMVIIKIDHYSNNATYTVTIEDK